MRPQVVHWCTTCPSCQQGGLEKKDITTLLTRASELAADAGQLPSDRFNDHAFVITAALQASNALVRVVDFLPVSCGLCLNRWLTATGATEWL